MTTPPKAPYRRPSGFTMIELVMTMVIVGIMAVVALPRMDMLRGFDEAGYRDKVKATLEYARKSAVAQRRNVRVTIATNVLSVEYQQQTPEGEGTASWLPLNLPGSNSHQFSAPGSVALSPDTSFTFDPLGRPSFAASLSLNVSGGGNITIEAETGYVH